MDDKVAYVVELKIDGVSLSLSYAQGELAVAATRGDGQFGDDITDNVRQIKDIPQTIESAKSPKILEVRGEVFMTRSAFEAINQEKEDEQDDLFVNPRNAAAGSLKLLDPSIVSKRGLKFYAHGLGVCQPDTFETQSEYYAFLKRPRFP